MILALTVAYAVLATAYSASLDVTVARTVGGGGTSTTYGNAISVLSTGPIVLSGTTNGNVGSAVIGSNNGFVRVSTQDGTVLKTKQESAGTGGIVQFVSSALDSQNNIYVVGPCAGSFYGGSSSGNLDVCVIKYDSSLNVLATFVTGADNVDLPNSIAFNNADGSIYIVGYTNSAVWNGQGPIGARDGFLLKMSITGSTGTLQGVYRFGVGGVDTFFQGVAVDSIGNAWIAGFTAGATYQGQTSHGNAGVNDFLIQKMSPNGTVIFARLVGGFDHDLANAIALDPADSAYVAGYSLSTFDGNAPLGGDDVSVVKLDSSGTKKWSKLYGGTGFDRALALTYDKIKNVLLVTGYTLSAIFQGKSNPITTGTGSSFVLVIDPNTGAFLSARIYSGSSASTGNAIATNAAGVYLAGSTYGSFQGQALSGTVSAYMLKVERYASAPYDVSYLALGLNPGGSYSNGYDVAMFSNGDAVLGATTTGYLEAPSSNVQLMVQRYSSASGKVLWTAEAGGTGSEGLSRVAVDSSDNTFAVGSTTSAPAVGIDIFYAKFNSTGGTEFYKQYGGTGEDSATAVAVDSTGRFFYVVGTTNSPILQGYALIGPSGDSDGFVTKIDAVSGDIVRHRPFGCTPDCVTYFQAAAIDSTGSLWVAGTQGGGAYYGVSPISGLDVFIQKFDSVTGSSAFVTLVGGAGDDESKTISIDANDNMYVAAISGSTTVDGQTAPGAGSSSSILVVKWSSAGTKLWTKMFGGAGSDEVYGSAVDSNRGLLYLTGQTDSATFYGATNTNSAANPFLLVLNVADGTVVYAAVYPSTSNSQGRGLVTNGVSTYMVGTAVTNLLGQTVNPFMSTFLLKLVGNLPGPTAAPSRAPTAIITRAPTGPSRVPTASPTGPYTTGSSIIGANPYNSYSAVYGIAGFSNGDVLMAGITTGYVKSPAFNNYYFQFLFQRFTPSGTLLWSAEVGGTNDEFLTGVVVDVNNLAYASGFTYSASVGGSDVAYAKITQTSGTSPVATYYQYGGTGDDSAAAVAVDSTGSFFYLVGKTNSPTLQGQTLIGVVDGFVTKINAATGAIVWHRQYGCATCTTSFSAAAMDSVGNLWVTGAVQGGPYYTKASVGGTDLIVQKFATSTGDYTFVDRVGGTGDDVGTSIAIDSSNNVYAAGSSYSTTVDGQTAPGAGSSMLVVMFNSTGAKQWTRLYGDDGDYSVTGISVNAASNQLTMSVNYNNPFKTPSETGKIVILSLVLIAGVINPTLVAIYVAFEGFFNSPLWIAGLSIFVGTVDVLLTISAYTHGHGWELSPVSFQAATITKRALPTYQPTATPTFQPTRVPTRQPSRLPTSQPSRQPSSQPSRQPTSQPSASPTNYCVKWAKDHTSAPTRQPTYLPTIAPSYKPTFTVTATPTLAPIAACISGWAAYGNKCYRTNYASMTYDACRDYCPTMAPGAGMLCIETAAQNAWITATLGTTSWIGYSDVVSEGNYVWGPGGCTSTYTAWSAGQPDNTGSSGAQNWAMLQKNGLWDDVSGSVPCSCEYTRATTCAAPGARRLEEEEVIAQAVTVPAAVAAAHQQQHDILSAATLAPVPAVATSTPKLRGHSLIKSLFGTA